MASKFVQDIDDFTNKFSLDEGFNIEQDMEARLGMIAEELFETEEALDDYVSAATSDRRRTAYIGMIDGLIDLAYFALGTLRMLKVDTDAHWDAVHSANMEKVRGLKASRPNTKGRDVVKPEGWESPEIRHSKILENRNV